MPRPRLFVPCAADELAVALERRQAGREPDHERDAQTGEILGAFVTVGIAVGRCLLADPEAEEHDSGRADIGEVVKGIAEEADRARQDRDPKLCETRQRQPGGGDADCPRRKATVAGLSGSDNVG
jgi:hypothetical protein